MRLSYEDQVRGRTVIDATGSSIGEVDSLYLESESIDAGGLRVSGIRVKLHSEVADAIGIAHGTFRAGAVDVPAEAIRAVGDAVLLSVAISSLVQHPAAAPSP